MGNRGAIFWRRVDKQRCWNWMGALTESGYGVLQVHGKKTYAHRFAWIASGRTVTAGLVLDHKCRNRSCVNPSHLEQVTIAENVRRGAAAVTSCIVRLSAGIVQSIERTSPSTAEFLRDTPKEEWMAGCHGPMKHSEAETLRRQIWAARPPMRDR